MKRVMKIQASKKREESRVLSGDALEVCTGGIPLGRPPDKEPPPPGLMAGNSPPPKDEPPPS